MTYKYLNGQLIELTKEEEQARLQDIENSKSELFSIKLSDLRIKRNSLLVETDYLGLSDNTMSSDWIAKRKSWRDIPQDYSEDKYDELLAKDELGNLTHTVWSKP